MPLNILEVSQTTHLPQAELALRSLHIESPKLQQLLDPQQTSLDPTPAHVQRDLLDQYKQQGLTFDEFCCMYAELKYILLKSVNSGSSLFTSFISTPLRWITSECKLQVFFCYLFVDDQFNRLVLGCPSDLGYPPRPFCGCISKWKLRQHHLEK